MKKHYKSLIFLLIIVSVFFAGCGEAKERVVIYTTAEDYIVEDMIKRLDAEFPEYDIVLEYFSTGNHAAKLMAEGKNSECDISYELEYGYMEQLSRAGILADLSEYDTSIYSEDATSSNDYLVQCRIGGAIVFNTDLLKEKELAEPTCYEDLLKPEYKGLISMPNPKSSGTGYVFLKSLVNTWGEEKAFQYFDKLTPNILQYTTSGAGPVNALIQREAAIGLGMTSHAVIQINEGSPLKVVFFEEGSPFTLYGMGIVAGKEDKPAVKAVFDFLVNTYSYELNEKFFPEQMFKDKTYVVENYPENINYADMSNNTIEEKERLLAKWAY